MPRLRAALHRAAQTPLGRRAAPPVRRLVRPKTFRYVFVVTYGRSGSTLVQGLLNTLPRTLVRGENNLYVLPLFRSMVAVRSFRRLHRKHNPQVSHSAFFGLHEIEPESFERATRELMTSHMLGSASPREIDVLGFKEVLWHRVRPDETQRFFGFLDRTFPGCLFVLNEREHDRVVDSGFWQSRDREEVLAAISRVEEIQRHLREAYPERILDLRYELLTSDDRTTSDEQLRALARFVTGDCDDALLAELRRTRETGHGPFPFGKSHGRREAREQRQTDGAAQED